MAEIGGEGIGAVNCMSVWGCAWMVGAASCTWERGCCNELPKRCSADSTECCIALTMICC